MRVPFAASASAVEDLHETDTAFDEATRDQALFAKGFRIGIVDAVHFAGGFRLLFQLQRFGN